MNRRIVADIPEMGIHRILYGDLLAGDAQAVHQFPSILIGAVGSAEARHGDAPHIAGRTAQLGHSLHRHQQRQGGIQAAGNTDHGFCANGLQPLGKAGSLDLKHRIAFLGICRNERQLI